MALDREGVYSSRALLVSNQRGTHGGDGMARSLLLDSQGARSVQVARKWPDHYRSYMRTMEQELSVKERRRLNNKTKKEISAPPRKIRGNKDDASHGDWGSLKAPLMATPKEWKALQPLPSKVD